MANIKTSKSVKSTTISAPPSLHKAKSPTQSTLKDDLVDVFVVIPPDGGWGWIVVAASFVANGLMDGWICTFGLFLDVWASYYKVSVAHVSLAGSIATGLYYLGGPLISGLTNRFGFRAITIVGSLITSATMFLTPLCNSIEMVYVVFGVFGGIGLGMIFMPAVIVVGFYFEKWRAVATGIAVCGSGIGTVVLPPFVGYLLTRFSWRHTFWIMGGVMLLCIVCGLLYRPLHPVRVSATDDTKAVQFESPSQSTLQSIEVLEEHSGIMKKLFGGFVNRNYPTVADMLVPSGTTLASTVRSSAVSVPSASISKASVLRRMSVASRFSDHRLDTVLEEDIQSRKNCCSCCCKPCRKRRRKIPVDRVTASRPLYRDDIFYHGSLALLPEYSRPVIPSQKSVDYHLSVTRVTTAQDVADKNILCSEAVRRTLATMLDFSLMKSPSFVLIAVSGMFTLVGLYVPYVYILDRASETGMPKDLSCWLISTIGLANTFGRIVSGFLTTLPNVNALIISYVSLGIGGIATSLSSYLLSTWGQFAFAVVYGLSLGLASLRPIVIVDLYGLEKLSNAFGILLVFQGFGALVGSPLAGYVRGMFEDYTFSFWISGGFITLSAVLLLPVQSICKWENRRKERKRLSVSAVRTNI